MKGRKHAKATKWDSNAEHNRQAAAQRLLQNVIFSFLISLILFLKKLENDHFYCFLALDFIRSLSLSLSLFLPLSLRTMGLLGFLKNIWKVRKNLKEMKRYLLEKSLSVLKRKKSWRDIDEELRIGNTDRGTCRILSYCIIVN